MRKPAETAETERRPIIKFPGNPFFAQMHGCILGAVNKERKAHCLTAHVTDRLYPALYLISRNPVVRPDIRGRSGPGARRDDRNHRAGGQKGPAR